MTLGRDWWEMAEAVVVWVPPSSDLALLDSENCRRKKKVAVVLGWFLDAGMIYIEQNLN